MVRLLLLPHGDPMTGVRTHRMMATMFAIKDRVVTASGRKGRVIAVPWGNNQLSEDEYLIHWDDGEEFAMRDIHLTLLDRPFGQETSREPDPKSGG